MSIIRILPEDVSNRIAAGEVVERPASVVKELVENALDARATHVAVHAQRGGRTAIRVVDDGFGMDAEDALLCLEAHATSKIRSADDIEFVSSLGFRGEAIPSIASVCHFELRTRPAAADVGTEVLVDGGVIRHVSEVGCPVGTAVTARNLFYNVPARRKFLRAIETEEFHISEVVLLAALAHPGVGFQLTLDHRPILSVQPDNDLYSRATMVLGKEMMSAMLRVEHEEQSIVVSGFVARPGLTRATRREQRMFVNGRPVDSDAIYHTIRDAYHTLVMKGRHPPAVLFVRLPSDAVDVNVHPAKREVRFRDDRMVRGVVGAGIRRALRELASSATPAPAPLSRPAPRGSPSPMDLIPPPSVHPLIVPRGNPISATAGHDTHVDHPAPAVSTIRDHDTISAAPASMSSPTAPATTPPSRGGTSVSAATAAQIHQLRVLGTVAELFLVAEGPEGIVLVDQHAAHERIMFEKVLRDLRNRECVRQGLLLPITVEFSAADADVLNRHQEQLGNIGFDIEGFGGNTFVVTAVPAHFPKENIAGILREMVDELQESPWAPKRLDAERVAQIACKAAVKAHDRLSAPEIAGLLHDLARTELPYTCPHGRPTMINISYAELEKRFGRRH